MGVGEGERQRGRETERERDWGGGSRRGRETERERDREGERQRGRETGVVGVGEGERQRGRETGVVGVGKGEIETETEGQRTRERDLDVMRGAWREPSTSSPVVWLQTVSLLSFCGGLTHCEKNDKQCLPIILSITYYSDNTQCTLLHAASITDVKVATFPLFSHNKVMNTRAINYCPLCLFPNRPDRAAQTRHDESTCT